MRSFLLGVFLYVVFLVPAWAGSVAGTGGSTEFTQILNNGQLAASVGKQSQQVANQIRQIMVEVEQKMLMVQNLQKLPAAAAAIALGPLQKDLRIYTDLYRAVADIKAASQQAAAMLQQRGSEAAYMKLSPKEYLAQEIALAKTRGGNYAREFDRDVARLENFNTKSIALAEATKNATQASGTVEGLAALATQNAIAGSAMLDMAQVITEQKAAVAMKSQEEQLRIAATGEQTQREMAAKAAQEAADKAAAAQFKLEQPTWWKW
ncbi:MAG: hypothetical protein KKG92_07310 [Gammaproteobacteria bacterium]|nr:hypothetical protein [Gammaproteobacteria bacterium]